MRLIIDIPNEMYKCVQNGTYCGTLYEELKNGTPLSESEDCVSRQAVLDLAKFDGRENLGSIIHAFDVEQLPPVKPAEKVGRWIKSEIPNEEYVCSECGGACWYYDVEKGVAKSRFCPNCGAKMGGEQNE